MKRILIPVPMRDGLRDAKGVAEVPRPGKMVPHKMFEARLLKVMGWQQAALEG